MSLLGLHRSSEHLHRAVGHMATAWYLAREDSPEHADQIEALFKQCDKLEREIKHDMEDD